MAARAEESPAYPGVVALLNARWRVIACSDGIQWILQKRSGQRWDNRYFCRSREGLMACCREYAGEIGGDALVVLLRLPPFFAEGA